MISIASPGTQYKLTWFCLPPSQSKLPTSYCCDSGDCMDLSWAFGDLFRAGVKWGPSSLSTHHKAVLKLSLSIGPLWALTISTLTRGSAHTHSDSLLGLAVFPVLSLSFSASIHPVLVTVATGEIQSQYLLAASVTQPSTRIARLLFLCLFNVPKPEVRCIWARTPRTVGLVWNTPSHTVFRHVFFVCLYTCAHACFLVCFGTLYK